MQHHTLNQTGHQHCAALNKNTSNGGGYGTMAAATDMAQQQQQLRQQ
jgi:hypothetical protein